MTSRSQSIEAYYGCRSKRHCSSCHVCSSLQLIRAAVEIGSSGADVAMPCEGFQYVYGYALVSQASEVTASSAVTTSTLYASTLVHVKKVLR